MQPGSKLAQPRSLVAVLAITLLSAIAGCGGGSEGATTVSSPPGLQSLLLTTSEPPSSNCGIGGLKVQTGLDTNRDGVLQINEVTGTSYICRLPASADKSWRGAVSVESGSGTASEPQIAFDSQGNALAVWYQYDGTVFSIMANRFTVGLGWGVAAPIESGAGEANLPQIAMDAQGNALAVWVQGDGQSYSIMANRYTQLAGWGTAVAIETSNYAAYEPQIAVDSNGNAWAVWYQYDGVTLNVMANRYTVSAGGGSSWATAEMIDSGADAASRAQVAIDTAGNATVVWQQFDGGVFNIMAKRHVVGTGWGMAAAIETGSGETSAPQVAVDARGNALAVWVQREGAAFNVMANRYTLGGSGGGAWGTAAAIETGAGTAFNPKIAVNANGEAFAVWYQSNGADNSIMANRFAANSGWGVATAIEANARNNYDSQVVIDANGNALALWVQSDGTTTRLFYNRYIAGVGWGAEAVIETGSGNINEPQIAIDANGNALAVWAQGASFAKGIMSNRFN